jgi:hypothetical protein
MFHYKEGLLSGLSGTDGNDLISMACNVSECLVKVNSEEKKLSLDKIRQASFAINAFAGDDDISIEIPKEVFFADIALNTGYGHNVVKLFVAPRSFMDIDLGHGDNLLIFNESGGRNFIKNFCNSVNNKIKIITKTPHSASVVFKKESTDLNTNTLYFKASEDATEKEFAVIYNKLNSQEYKFYAELKLLNLEGNQFPDYLSTYSYVLDGPRELETVISENNALIFAEE